MSEREVNPIGDSAPEGGADISKRGESLPVERPAQRIIKLAVGERDLDPQILAERYNLSEEEAVELQRAGQISRPVQIEKRKTDAPPQPDAEWNERNFATMGRAAKIGVARAMNRFRAGAASPEEVARAQTGMTKEDLVFEVIRIMSERSGKETWKESIVTEKGKNVGTICAARDHEPWLNKVATNIAFNILDKAFRREGIAPTEEYFDDPRDEFLDDAA